MNKRIVGLEHEYGISLVVEGNLQVGSHVASLMFSANPKNKRDFLQNGARCYIDYGSHPEYSTPECVTLKDLLAADLAGQRIILELLTNISELVRLGIGEGETQIYRINIDNKGQTFGCHENYLIERAVLAKEGPRFATLVNALVPHFVSRTVYVGAGNLTTDGEFQISQRAPFIEHVVSDGTTRARGIINTRDEPLSNKEKYARLHVICGDSNMAEIPTFLKVGVTSLILSLIEKDKSIIGEQLALSDPVASFKKISRDLTMQTKIPLKSGRKLTAIEIQREYLELVKTHLTDLLKKNQEYKLVVALWEKILEMLEKDVSSCAPYLDWVSKKSLIDLMLERHGLPMTHPKLQALAIQYHEISPKGIYNIAVKKGHMIRLIDEALVEVRMTTPPNTRAKVRGDFIKWAYENNFECYVNWSSVSISRPSNERLITIGDPFATHNTKISELMS